MPARNPFAEYTTNKILTASPAEVTLMLYEGAIKFCNIAIVAIEHGGSRKRISILRRHSVLSRSSEIPWITSIRWRRILTESMCICSSGCYRQISRRTRQFWRK